ncbi:MAG TPA: histidinol-phosphate transaminase [Candidatus Sphingobacterium stercoripullorum]|nr:histidinol-phosphate transaminase [Candidatus Sphingobacterium stercoripullorum]
MAFDINTLLRENIKSLVPYSSARSEFKGQGNIMVDANENAYGSPLAQAYNRYPDPLQWDLKSKITAIKGVPPANIFLGNGSDEAIDLLFRAFCEPGEDNVIILPPTYGMYQVSAQINNVACKEVPLLRNFQLDMEGIEASIDDHTKMIFICSPNNPTGNSIDVRSIETILMHFPGLVVVDEAYINYARQKSLTYALKEFPNLVVLQTLSKAWGLAGIRLGLAFSSEEIIQVLNQIKPPYNINQATQELALEALNGKNGITQVNQWIKDCVQQRGIMAAELQSIDQVIEVVPSEANFLLVRFEKVKKLFEFLLQQGIVVRDRSSVPLCENSLRITVGKPEENRQILDAIKNFYQNKSTVI